MTIEEIKNCAAFAKSHEQRQDFHFLLDVPTQRAPRNARNAARATNRAPRNARHAARATQCAQRNARHAARTKQRAPHSARHATRATQRAPRNARHAARAHAARHATRATQRAHNRYTSKWRYTCRMYSWRVIRSRACSDRSQAGAWHDTSPGAVRPCGESM